MDILIIQQIVLGIVQGITEWLPVSSSGILALILSNFFNVTNIPEIITQALFLHLGTFFAALVYFRKDVSKLFYALFKWKKSSPDYQKIFSFLFISTLISGAIGLAILQLLDSFSLEITGKAITFGVGFLLLITGIFQIKVKSRGLRNVSNIKKKDSVLLGFAQGFSVLPGLSRSGITISSLLIDKFDDTTALRLSFLMSLPIVLFGNLLLNWGDFTINNIAIYGVLASFVFGLATIHGMMKLSRKINFGYFVLIFALLMMASILI